MLDQLRVASTLVSPAFPEFKHLTRHVSPPKIDTSISVLADCDTRIARAAIGR